MKFSAGIRKREIIQEAFVGGEILLLKISWRIGPDDASVAQSTPLKAP